MKSVRTVLFFVFAGISSLLSAEWPYSNDLTLDVSDWTFSGNSGMAISNGSLAPVGSVPTLGYVTDTTDWNSNMAVSVRVNLNPAAAIADSASPNPMVMARVGDGNNFYFYRVTSKYASNSADAEIYSFSSSKGNNQLSYAAVSGFDKTQTTLYYRFNTLTVGSGVHLLGEASYEADFSTILNRLKKVETTNLQSGTSAGVRAYSIANYASYNDFSAAALNVWTNVAGGAWETASNWSGGTVPDGAGALADFSMVDLTVPTTVSVAGSKTVGRLIFGDMTGGSAWTLSGDGITLNSGTTGSKSVITVDSASSVTINNKLTSADDVAVNGGGTVNLVKASGNSLTGDWFVSGGSVLSTNNHQTYTAKKASDEVFGSGTIHLDGANLRAVQINSGSYNIRVNNDVVVSGNSILSSNTNTELYMLGSISGSGNLTENVTYSLKLYGDNSAYTGNWTMTGDYIWGGLKTNATPQNDWKGTGDYSFGSGTITLSGGTLGILSNNAYILNDLIVPSEKSTYLVKGASIANLSGKITGSGTININSNSTGAINLLGDNSAFAGTWNLTARKVVTNNTDSAKVTGAGDSRFGSGQINIGFSTSTSNDVTTVYNGSLAAASGQNVYVHNNIKVTQDKNNEFYGTKQFQPFITPADSRLTLTGALTGNADIYKSDAGTLALAGNGTAYAGDWYITGGKIVTSNNNSSASGGADQRFGTGTIHIGNAILSCTDGGAKYIHNNMEITGPVTVDLTGGYELFLKGNLTGSGTITRAGGDLTFGVTGDNTGFSGNWIIKQDVVRTNNTTTSPYTGVDRSFGSGILYLNGGGLTTEVSNAVVDCDVVIQGGQQIRGAGYTFRGIFALENNVTANSTHSFAQPTLTFTNQLIGNGKINAQAIFEDGSVIAPGDKLMVDSVTGERSVTAGIGTLTFNRNLTLNEGTTLSVDMASLTNYDRIVMNVTEPEYSNALSLNGTTMKLNFLEGFDATDLEMFDAYDVFTGADLSGSDLPALEYDVDALLASGAYDGARLALVFNEGKLQLMAVNASYVPEPCSWLLLGLGVGLLGLCSRFFAPPSLTENGNQVK